MKIVCNFFSLSTLNWCNWTAHDRVNSAQCSSTYSKIWRSKPFHILAAISNACWMVPLRTVEAFFYTWIHRTLWIVEFIHYVCTLARYEIIEKNYQSIFFYPCHQFVIQRERKIVIRHTMNSWKKTRFENFTLTSNNIIPMHTIWKS